MPLWSYWLWIVIILSVVEVSTNNLVTIWFVASALVSLILSFFTENSFILIGNFVLLGVLLLITTKSLFEKYLKKDNVKTNLDRVVGMIGICTEEIKKNVIGEVKVDGKKWSAISKDVIKVGDEVLIEKIDGVKLIVRKEGE
ncbi:MAG: NfeD family protein [Firmicutes bacterium]|nr:NfeD family protein [Bacillota bacterium]